MVAEIWKYFVKITGQEKAKCLHCKREYAHKGSSTKGLWDHFSSCQPEKYKKVKCLDFADEKLPETKAAKITSHFDVVSNEEVQLEQAEESLLRIMARQNASFRLFDDPDLKFLFKRAYPDLKLKAREHFRRHRAPIMAAKIKREIVQSIGSKFFAITSDGWQKPTKTPSFLSVTVHFCDENFIRHDKVLAATSIEGDHTADNISSVLANELESNEMDMSKILAMVRDDASVMKKSAGLLSLDSFQCACHFLNLAVSDVLFPKNIENSSADVKRMVDKCKDWIAFLRTAAGSALLARHQKEKDVTQNKIPAFSPTRWNSFYYMLLALHEQKDILSSIEGERIANQMTLKTKRAKMSINIRPAPENLPSFTNDDFLLLKELCKILKPFDAVTKKLSEEQSTASSILSAFKTLKDFLERHSNNDKNLEESRSIAAKLHEAVTIRYERLQNDKILCISMLIDKRFAYDTNIKTPLEWLKIEEDFISYCKTELKLDGSEAITQTQSDATDVPMQFGDPMAQNSDSSDEDYDIFGKRAPTPALSQVSTGTDAEFTANIKSELAKFVSLEKPDPNTVNIFKWCRKYLGQFPVISKAAQALLSIPATSVCSERLFSKATLLYSNALRNRLQSDTAENILIIKASLNQFPLQVTEEQEADEEDSMLELLILE